MFFIKYSYCAKSIKIETFLLYKSTQFMKSISTYYVLNKLSPEQSAYIAGFLDADGSIIAQIVQRNDRVLKYFVQVSVTFFQKDKRAHFAWVLRYFVLRRPP